MEAFLISATGKLIQLFECVWSVVSSFRRRVNEIYPLLGCYAGLIGSYLTTVSGQHIGPIFKGFRVLLNP